jgi:hypothetical protein
MEKEISRKPCEVSDRFYASRAQIYDYGIDVFGYFQAERYDKQYPHSFAGNLSQVQFL